MAYQPRTSRFPVSTQPSAESMARAHDPAPVVADPGVPGTVLGGRYRVGECLGAGAMGVVWAAYDRRLRRTVAVKQLVQPPRGAHDPTEARLARTRALREGRIAARVVHPRAIAVFDVVEHDAATWLVMEYLPSRSLAAVLAEHGPLEPGVVAHLGAQIADALAAVHEAGIVHGDVKPGNVLIGEDGVAKITDFGVSRASWDTTATGGGAVAGTPGYFAPEVARGEDPTPASDVFSLGATLYAAVENELVCGRLDNTLAVLHAMAEARLRPATRAGILGRPLAAMLRADPEHRPDPADVRRALRARAVTGPVVLAAPAPTAPADGPATQPPEVPSGPPSQPAVDRPVAPPAPAVDPRDAPPTPVVNPPVAPPAPVVPAPRSADDGWSPLALTPGPAGGPVGRPSPTTRHPVGRAGRPRAGRGRRAVVVVAAVSVIVLGGAAGAAIATLGSGAGDPPVAAPQAQAPSAPPVPSPRAAAPAPAPESGTAGSTAPPGVIAADTPVGDEEAVRTVADYYGALPGDPDRSWALLAGSARDDSGGYDGYRRFWGGITSVRAVGLAATGGSVRADIEFVTSRGRTSREPYRFELGRDDDGRVVITAARRSADAT